MSSSAFNLKMYPVTKKVEELLAKELFFTELNTTATCLICRQKVLYRVFNMKRHYTVKHAEQYNKYKEEERKVVSDRLHADFNYNRSTGGPELKEESKPGQITTVMPSLKLISATDTQYSAAVLKSMNEQRNHGLFCDVTIIIQDKKFRAHKTVLSASSTYFHQLFSVAGQVIELNFIRAEIFEEILNYIYSSKIVRVRSDMLEELINAGQILGVKFIANLGLPLSHIKGLPGLSKEYENKNDTESTEMMPIITESFSISAEEFNQTSKSALDSVSQTDAQTKQKASRGEVIDLDSAYSENVASKQSEKSDQAVEKHTQTPIRAVDVNPASITSPNPGLPNSSPLHSPDSSSNNSSSSPARVSSGSAPVNVSMFQVLLLRVVISKEEARRVQLSQVPETVDALIDLIKEKLQLQGDFSLQFEDPDFQNALCNLSDISELPDSRAVLHIQWKKGSWHAENDSQSLGSISSLDTVSMSSSESQANILSPGYLRSLLAWPDPFPIPALSLDVELKLRRGNEAYEKTKISIDVSRDMKIEILDKIAQSAFDIKAYPEHGEIESIASSLILKYPCLKEPGKGKGYEGWLVSIRNKLNNYRAKLREAGCSEVSVNKKRRVDGGTTKYTLKRARRGEVNYVPQHPQQQDDASLEEQRLLLVEASKKAQLDRSLVREKMDLTFSLRRREIVEEQPMVVEVQNRWPALFFKEQICEEFFRITNKDLLGTFRTAVDKYTPKLLRLYRARKGAFGKEMEEVLEKLDDETSNIVRHRKDAALRGLPVFLREEPKDLFKQCLECDPEEEATTGVAVGLLLVLEEGVAPTSSAMVRSIAVILEDTIVLDEIPDLPSALAYLFGLLYALNMSYPKTLKYTFDAFQHIFMEVGSDCTQRVRSLKNKLLL